jgi:hypothetical protein
MFLFELTINSMEVLDFNKKIRVQYIFVTINAHWYTLKFDNFKFKSI